MHTTHRMQGYDVWLTSLITYELWKPHEVAKTAAQFF